MKFELMFHTDRPSEKLLLEYDLFIEIRKRNPPTTTKRNLCPYKCKILRGKQYFYCNIFQ